MRVRVAIACSGPPLSERLGKLLAGDPDFFLVRTMMPPFEPQDVIRLRSDVVVIDSTVLCLISGDLLHGNDHGARFILITEETGKSTPSDREIAELIARSALAGIIPAAAKGRLLKKAVKAVASGELWLGPVSTGGAPVRH